MKKLWINLFLLVFVNFLGAKSFVIGNGTTLFKDPDLQHKAGFLPGGFSVNPIKKHSKTWFVSSSMGKGYLKASRITQTPNVFSTTQEPLILDSTIHLQNSNHILVYTVQQKLVFYNILNRAPSFKDTLPSSVDVIQTSENLQKVLLIGYYHDKQQTIDNYALYTPENHQFVEIGSFRHQNQLLSTANFSKDGHFLFLLFTNQKKLWLYLYSTKSGALIGSFSNLMQADWNGNQLIILSSKGLYKLQPSLDKWHSESENKLWVSWPQKITSSDKPNIRILNNTLYMSLKNRLYKIDPAGKIHTSSLRSLLFTDRYQYFEKKGSHYLQSLSTKKNLRHFGGIHPKREFYGFFGEKILYQAPVEKTQTFFLLNPLTQSTYKYKSIDRIDASSKEGVLAEKISEKDLNLIVVEVPDLDIFYFIQERADPKTSKI